MKLLEMIILLFLFGVIGMLANPVSAQIKISNSVFGNGAAVVSDTNNTIIATIGQPVIGVAANANNTVSSGFWYVTGSVIVTSVEELPGTLPTEFRLYQNYPNPFNPTTTIQFDLPAPSEVTIIIFDIQGREVTTLLQEQRESGVHKVTLEASDIPSGVYFYRIHSSSGKTKNFVQTKKFVLLK